MTKATSGTRPIVSAFCRVGTEPGSLWLVDSDLASAKNGISERFVPERDQGRLIEVEHIVRYQWAAQVAKGRAVLDAGCGTAYGCRLLAGCGAREVTGVDIAGSVLEAVSPTMPESVQLYVGDLRGLDFPDDSFELVVCFEVVEHLEDPFVVLDELARVLSPGGLLLVSSPNRGVYQAGNPHHFHEFDPSELESGLARRLGNVRLLRQQNYVVSAVLSDDTSRQGDGGAVDNVALHKLVADSLAHQTYTIAIASDGPLPDMRELAAMTGTLELREWLSVFETQTRAMADKDNCIVELTARVEERDRLAQLLAEAESRVANVAELKQRISDLEFELEAASSAATAARQEADQLDRMLIYGRRMLRFVRPLINPLRRLRRKLRG
jgi:ubiquinone/menaquinone biosynthesis C-methylase UbiE